MQNFCWVLPLSSSLPKPIDNSCWLLLTAITAETYRNQFIGYITFQANHLCDSALGSCLVIANRSNQSKSS